MHCDNTCNLKLYYNKIKLNLKNLISMKTFIKKKSKNNMKLIMLSIKILFLYVIFYFLVVKNFFCYVY